MEEWCSLCGMIVKFVFLRLSGNKEVYVCSHCKITVKEYTVR